MHNSSATTHIPQLISHNSFLRASLHSRPSSFLVSVSLLRMHPFLSKLSGLCKATSVISRCSRLYRSRLVCAKLPPSSADASGSRKRMLHVANTLKLKRFGRLIFLHSCAAAGLSCFLLNLEWCLVLGSVCMKRAALSHCRPLLQTGCENEMEDVVGLVLAMLRVSCGSFGVTFSNGKHSSCNPLQFHSWRLGLAVRQAVQAI